MDTNIVSMMLEKFHYIWGKITEYLWEKSLPVYGHEDKRVDGHKSCDNDEKLDRLAPGVAKGPHWKIKNKSNHWCGCKIRDIPEAYININNWCVLRNDLPAGCSAWSGPFLAVRKCQDLVLLVRRNYILLIRTSLYTCELSWLLITSVGIYCVWYITRPLLLNTFILEVTVQQYRTSNND
jgi:hypothetical protein